MRHAPYIYPVTLKVYMYALLQAFKKKSLQEQNKRTFEVKRIILVMGVSTQHGSKIHTIFLY